MWKFIVFIMAPCFKCVNSTHCLGIRVVTCTGSVKHTWATCIEAHFREGKKENRCGESEHGQEGVSNN